MEESITIEATEQPGENRTRVLDVQIKCSKSLLEVSDFLAGQGAYTDILKFLKDALGQDIQRYVEGGQDVISQAITAPPSSTNE